MNLTGCKELLDTGYLQIWTVITLFSGNTTSHEKYVMQLKDSLTGLYKP